MHAEILDVGFMNVVFPKGRIKYTGKEIEPLWAFNMFDVQKDSIVAFRGGMEVKIENMKDLKDVKEEGEFKIPIKGDDCIHFIVEHFDNPDLKMIYLRQRILICIAKDTIESFGVKLDREGDDLYCNGKKLSVCIATRGVSSAKIHLGINVNSKGIPEHVEGIGLEDIGIFDIEEVMRKIAISYAKEMEKIEKDIRKTAPLY
ncbi:DUF366 family protein [Methanotorris igneus]|uniref:DUF366 domain-containing protein n=1 Tax=Methanotorris igneus (strain DSM 5666 / JCM 11834 / Kol 5) TaxID=880724 RepID=F6BE30_METIK|nr:DUF366 family protein [Methanotorris igneus]AEF95566.1 protein of unknown function DUF366 [Methanotorris igneus Kol 5]